jgi:uncharacterized protein (DUF302 family)
VDTQNSSVEFRSYAILGACNPPLAHRELSTDPVSGLRLLCNLTVEALSEYRLVVRIADPQTMLAVGNLGKNEILHQVSQETHRKLKHAADNLAQPAQ